MDTFITIFCLLALSVTLVASRPQDLLGEVDDYQYGIDLSKLEDELLDQAGVTDDKLFLQHLLSKWKTSTTTTEYPFEESSTETTTTSTTPEPTTTTTTEPTTTATTTTTREAATTKAAIVTPFTAIFNGELPSTPNTQLYTFEKPNAFPMGAYPPAPVYQPPTYSYYPVSHYNIPPQMPQMTQSLPGVQGMTQFSGLGQPMAGLHAVPYVPAIPRLPQTMFSMPGMSHLQAYNPYAQYPMQFISPVYSPYRTFKK